MSARNERKPCEEIAPRLRGLREALDLSPETLGERIGTDPGEVIRYESGTEEIPVSHLFRVAQACGVDLTVLISGGDAHLKEYSLVRAGEGLSVDRRKDYKYQSLAYRFSQRRMEPFLVRVPPKEEGELTFNRHSGQEFIHMLEGRLEIRVGESILVLEPGDSFYLDSSTPHALRGLDGAEALFLDVII
jgi:transcriptional regulator with XRE-family HTH domain